MYTDHSPHTYMYNIHVAGAALANGSSGIATSGGASSRGAGASVEGRGAGNDGGGGSLGRLQLKGVLDGLVKRSINEDK